MSRAGSAGSDREPAPFSRLPAAEPVEARISTDRARLAIVRLDVAAPVDPADEVRVIEVLDVAAAKTAIACNPPAALRDSEGVIPYLDQGAPMPALARAVTTLMTSTLALAGLAFALPPAGPQDPAREPEIRLAAFTIVTARFDAMVAFYRDVLGLDLARLDAESRFAEFANAGVKIHITTPATMKAASGSAEFDVARRGRPFELAFELPDDASVDRTYARLVARGAKPVAAPADKPWGQRVAFFADPDGHIHDVFARR